MNLALGDIGGEVLAVSQFTLAGSVRKGRRPSFDGAEEPARAAELFPLFRRAVEALGVTVETGVFQALMDVHIHNDGPVTFILESRRGAARGTRVRRPVLPPLSGGGPEAKITPRSPTRPCPPPGGRTKLGKDGL